MQYWPIFDLKSEECVGVCGLRPHGSNSYELGFHLRPAYWHQGYAAEAGRAAIGYAFETLHADSIFAGHHPDNIASKKVLQRLGFEETGKEYYKPTGLYHPSYILKQKEGADMSEMKIRFSDDASDFVSISDETQDVILEIRYYSAYNFIGERIRGYEEPLALMTKEAAKALKEAAADFKAQGYVIKIFDTYRPQMAVDHFAEWGKDTKDIRMKEYFYPELDKAEAFEKGFIAYHSGHSRGSTVDLTLVDMKTGKEVDMGGPFDWFGELSHPDYKGIADEQYNNRIFLQKVMVKHGFVPIDTEWWHFTLENEPYPDTYFTFPVAYKSLKK